MFVIVAGGGKTDTFLAQNLLNAGQTVRVIEPRAENVSRLKTELPEEVVVRGDGSDPQILSQVGVQAAQVVAAVTGNDQANLVVCTLARFEFAVPRCG